jgi:hypothetical protein
MKYAPGLTRSFSAADSFDEARTLIYRNSLGFSR